MIRFFQTKSLPRDKVTGPHLCLQSESGLLKWSEKSCQVLSEVIPFGFVVSPTQIAFLLSLFQRFLKSKERVSQSITVTAKRTYYL